MLIKKYKTFEEAEKDLWVLEPDENYYKKLRKILNFDIIINVKKFPRGIYKYKTFEEAENHRWKTLIDHC